ncbi:hypothetical protein CL659_00610 [bacterium]|nr:hypothetical protein [bacterium]|tara:strand:- start:26727 stop:27893 length:1167 start_codon:yes stop_codon:yes gene_type:complete
MKQLDLLIKEIQNNLSSHAVDGWFVADFHSHNPIARKFLPDNVFLSRRWALWIPKKGKAEMIVNGIESKSLAFTDVQIRKYQNFEDWKRTLTSMIAGKTIYVEWCEDGKIPYLSYLDGGLIDLLRSMDCSLKSSENISQEHLLLWSEKTIESHCESAINLTSIVQGVFDRVSKAKPFELDESMVQNWILESFEEMGMTTDHPPVVAVNGNAGDPHYATPKEGSARLGENFVLLIDLWATKKSDKPAYADITWMAKRGKVDKVIDKGFYAVLEARDAGVQVIKRAFLEKRSIAGYEVDQAVRNVIENHGFGEGFIHRTGHNLGLTSAHGDAAQLDSYEAKDTRSLLPGWAGTIEPGVYYPEWGIRSEINLVINPLPIVTTEPQKDWFLV